MSPEKAQNLLFMGALAAWCIRAFMFLLRPELSMDGPWVLSMIFSYMNGKGDYSLFAHEFSGAMFSTNLVDFVFSLWFRMTGVNTWGLISAGLLAILLTIIIWRSLLREMSGGKVWPMSMVLIYALSPYIYMFRPECFTILFGSIMVMCLRRMSIQALKWPIAVSLTVFAGLIHPMGGIFCGLVIAYTLLEGRYKWRAYLMVAGWCILLPLAMTAGHIFQYMQEYLGRSADVESHFSGPQLDLLVKYFIKGSPVLFLLLPFIFFNTGVYGRLSLSVAIIVLLLGGRSYYYPYLHFTAFSVLVFGIQRRENGVPELPGSYRLLLKLGISYSIAAFLVVPFALTLMNHQSNLQWKNILASIDREEASWEKTEGTRYYMFPEIGMETYDNINSRSMYKDIFRDYGVQDARGRVFYIYKKSQLKYIENSFDTKGMRWDVSEILPPKQGGLRPSSLYRLRPIYHEPTGLWKVQAVQDTIPQQHP
jgi:hypothetical protein